jgi:Zn finger protein HypA/HybF involved in hydrogenase expression
LKIKWKPLRGFLDGGNMNKFTKIIDKSLVLKCAECENEIEEGAIFNYCPECFRKYIIKLEDERVKNGNKKS